MRRSQLAIFPALAGWIGAAYIADPSRTATPSFDVARSILPMPMWGAVFLIGALVMTCALGTHSRTVMAWALTVGGGIYTWWALLFGIGAITDPHASLNGWALYGFIAAVHYQTAHYLKTRRAT